MLAGSLIAEPEQTRLEEIAPQDVEIAVAIHIEHRHRVGAMQRRLALADDLDVLELLGDELEARRAVRIEPLHFVARDRPIHTSEQHVELAVAVDVGELGDVLTIGVDGGALDILERVSRHGEARCRARADIPIVPDVAERRLGEQVVQPVAIDVHEPIPLADVDALEAFCRLPPASGRTLEELQLARILLNEQVEDTVAIDVDQLGTGMLETAEEWETERSAG